MKSRTKFSIETSETEKQNITCLPINVFISRNVLSLQYLMNILHRWYKADFHQRTWLTNYISY